MSQSQPWVTQYSKELGSRESVSGYGSSLINTVELRSALPEVIRKYGIKSIIDLPCGDWNWMKEVDLQGISYLGLDIVPDMIADNNKKYGADNIQFEVHDAINGRLPTADLIICRDFLFHIHNADVLKVLDNFSQSGSQFLLSTTFPKIVNTDIASRGGIGWRKINLCSQPYNYADPEYIIQENDSEACQNRIIGLFRLGQ